MRPTSVGLVLSCLFAVFASTCSAGPIDVSASVLGQISGRGGVDQSNYFIGPPVLLDFDPVFASVGPLAFSGGDGVSTGSLSGGAFARHPEERGDPGFLGIDMAGALVASRLPTGAGSFFPAGSMLVGVQATAEYRDDITFEMEHENGVPLTLEGFVFLEGFATLEAIATGGIDPNNVRARIVARLTGANSAPSVLATTKKATGEISVFPDASNILDFNPLINFSYDFFSGVPTPVSLKLELSGAAEFGDASFATLSGGTAIASFEAHFSNTLKWGGITRVVDRRTGESVTDYRITSASGFDYTQTFSIPEPGSLALFLFGVAGWVCQRRLKR